MYALVFSCSVLLGVEEARAQPAPPSVFELRRTVRESLQREARIAESAAWPQELRQLVALFEQLGADARLATSPTLQESRRALRMRLLRSYQDLRQKMGTPADFPPSDHLLLAGAGSPPSAGHEAATSGRGSSAESAKAWARGGLPFTQAEGQALIDLIQKTIVPNSWDVNGGPGVIRYYAPKKALVIRATSEIHGDVRGLLDDLRRN